jgi:FG-GAP-like repeat
MPHMLPRILVVVLSIAILGCQAQSTRTSVDTFDPTRVYKAADGRRYQLERMPKAPGGHTWINATTVRYFPHAIYEVGREDEAYLYVRQYQSVPVLPTRTERTQQAIEPGHSALYQWQAFDQGLPRNDQWRDQFAVADMNRDGHPDLVFGPARKGKRVPTIFLHDGQGQWQQWEQARFPALNFDYGAAAVADLDGDGHSDILLGMHLLGLAALTGDGKGNFLDASAGLPRRRGALLPILSSRKILALDWDGDREQDLLVLNEGLGSDLESGVRDGASIFRRENGSWILAPGEETLRHAHLMAQSTDSSAIAVSALNAPDGVLAISERRGRRWQALRISGFPDDVRFTALAMSTQRQRHGAGFAVAYVGRADNAWWVHIDLIAKGGGTWRRHPLLATKSVAEIRNLQFATLENASAPALIALDDRGQLDLYVPSAANDYTRDRSYAPQDWRLGCAGYGLQAVDLDGDGATEIVASFAGEPSVFAGTNDCAGGGGIQALKILPQGQSAKHQ